MFSLSIFPYRFILKLSKDMYDPYIQELDSPQEFLSLDKFPCGHVLIFVGHEPSL